MKRSLLFVCIGLLAATTASAQNPPAQSGSNNSAVNSPGQSNSNAPVAGRNSFTEGQAKSKIEQAGYTNVTHDDRPKRKHGIIGQCRALPGVLMTRPIAGSLLCGGPQHRESSSRSTSSMSKRASSYDEAP